VKKLLILGASNLQVPLITKAKSLGYKTIVLDMDKNAPGALIADVFVPTSTLDEEAVLKLASDEKITGIVTTSDMPVRVVAYVAEKLNLLGPTQSAAKICTSKSLQRELLKEHKFNYPQFQIISHVEDLKEVLNWNFPVIIKPTDSSASRGVQKVLSVAELKTAYEYALSNSRAGEVIIEEYIDGKEYSVEVLIQNNQTSIVAITEKLTSGFEDRFFVEEVHIVPAALTAEETLQVKEVVTRFLQVIKLDQSAAHVEVKLNSRGAFIIEAAARLGGDFITSDLVPLATGIDMLREIISISVGTTISSTHTRHDFAGIHFVTPDNYESAKVHLNKIRNAPGVQEFLIANKMNTTELKSSLDRLGHLIAKAKSREQLEQLLFF
jgi:biotin carboxylase